MTEWRRVVRQCTDWDQSPKDSLNVTEFAKPFDWLVSRSVSHAESQRSAICAAPHYTDWPFRHRLGLTSLATGPRRHWQPRAWSRLIIYTVYVYHCFYCREAWRMAEADGLSGMDRSLLSRTYWATVSGYWAKPLSLTDSVNFDWLTSSASSFF